MGLITGVFALAALIAALSIACYLVGRENVVAAGRSVYRETKLVVGTVARRGWRPLLPWIFILVAGGIGARVVMGLPLSIDVVQLVGVLGPLCVPTMLAQWTRSRETMEGRANADPLVNPVAIA